MWYHFAIYAYYTTLCSKCDQASDLCKQLELTSELESDWQDTVDWDKKWVVDFNAGKTQVVQTIITRSYAFFKSKMKIECKIFLFLFLIFWLSLSSSHFQRIKFIKLFFTKYKCKLVRVTMVATHIQLTVSIVLWIIHHSSSYTYIMCKLSSCFNVKDKIDFEHNHDLQIVLNQLASTIMWEKVLVEWQRG